MSFCQTEVVKEKLNNIQNNWIPTKIYRKPQSYPQQKRSNDWGI